MKTKKKDPSKAVVKVILAAGVIAFAYLMLYAFYPKADTPIVVHHDWAPLVAAASPSTTPTSLPTQKAVKPVSNPAPIAKPVPADPYPDAREQLIEAINAQRVAAGIVPLTRNLELDASAQAKADAEVRLNFFAHNDPDGSSPWHYIAEAGYVATYEGENLSKNYTPEQVVQAWLDSPTHRANILDPHYTQTGFAIEGIYIVEHFAAPAS